MIWWSLTVFEYLNLYAALMNIAQEIVPEAMIGAGIDCMWEPSAYVGSYGSFATPQIAKYIQNNSV